LLSWFGSRSGRRGCTWGGNYCRAHAENGLIEARRSREIGGKDIKNPSGARGLDSHGMVNAVAQGLRKYKRGKGIAARLHKRS
jgi:hypothetical protein